MVTKKWFNVLAIILCCSVFSFSAPDEHRTHAFTEQVIQIGAVGDDVIELQSRLQYIGFYNGKIDGVFGWQTYWALRHFQYEFGMKVDGLAGPKTKRMLLKATKYYEGFVKEQIRKGNKFTHYGGVDLKKQSAPQPKKPKAKKQQPRPKQRQWQPPKPNIAEQPARPKQRQWQPAKPNLTQKQQRPAGNEDQPLRTQNEQPQPRPQQGQGNVPSPTPRQNPDAAENREQATPQTQQAPPNKPTAANVPNGFSQNDIKLMANAVYGEARGESYIGQVAVAAVILNRIESPTFPNTVSGVIFEPGAFTAVSDGQIWLEPNETARKAVLDAINGWDPSGNAIYYFNPNTATNSWIWSRPQVKQIGKHIFCK